jgi:hypothetical protein
MPTAKPKQEETKSKASEFKSLTGKAMYAKVFEPAYPHPDYADTIPIRWTIDLLLDTAGKAKAQDMGMKFANPNPKYLQYVRENGLEALGYDGTHITASKAIEKKAWDDVADQVKTDKSGNVIKEPAVRPRVEDSARNEIPMEAFQDKGFKICNGSEVEVVFTLTKPSVGGFGRYGARLVRTKILELKEVETSTKGTFTYANEDSPF